MFSKIKVEKDKSNPCYISTGGKRQSIKFKFMLPQGFKVPNTSVKKAVSPEVVSKAAKKTLKSQKIFNSTPSDTFHLMVYDYNDTSATNEQRELFASAFNENFSRAFSVESLILHLVLSPLLNGQSTLNAWDPTFKGEAHCVPVYLNLQTGVAFLVEYARTRNEVAFTTKSVIERFLTKILGLIGNPRSATLTCLKAVKSQDGAKDCTYRSMLYGYAVMLNTKKKCDIAVLWRNLYITAKDCAVFAKLTSLHFYLDRKSVNLVHQHSNRNKKMTP